MAVLSSDMFGSARALKAHIADIAAGGADVIIGTQLVAKGHNFPKLTLVGVIDADMGLQGGDLRAAEKTFQILHQVAGRAGDHQGGQGRLHRALQRAVRGLLQAHEAPDAEAPAEDAVASTRPFNQGRRLSRGSPPPRAQKSGPSDQRGGSDGPIGSGWPILEPTAAAYFGGGWSRWILSRPRHMLDPRGKPLLKPEQVFAQTRDRF